MAFVSTLSVRANNRLNDVQQQQYCKFKSRTILSSSSFVTPLKRDLNTRFISYFPSSSSSSSSFKKTTPQCSDMGLKFPTTKYDEGFRIGVVSTRWNAEYVNVLRDKVIKTLKEGGIKNEDVVQMEVPGAFELPLAARLMCAAQKVDAVICIGVLIKGETDHYDFIASSVSSGLMDLQLSLSTPMIFGVLCCHSKQHVEDRTNGDKCTATDWAQTALEMANLKKVQLGGVSAGKKSVGFF